MLSSPRILQLGKFFAPYRGGIEEVTRAISEMLKSEGIRADALVIGSEGAGSSEVTAGYNVLRCPADLQLGSKAFSLRYVRAVKDLSPQYDAAILHMPNPLAVAAALLFWRKPIILMWHADTPQRLIRLLSWPMDSLLVRRAEAVVGLTPVHLEQSRFARAIVARGQVIGYPVSSPTPSSPGKSPRKLFEIRSFIQGRKLALSVGRLVPYKGFDVLIRAVANLAPDVAVVIVGDGTSRETLARQIEIERVGNRVMLAGPLDHESLNALISDAHIGCMPSVSNAEMYGIAQLEMMAAGKPVVATTLPRSGVPWVNRHGISGLLVPPGDHCALADSMNELCSNTELHTRLSRGARATATERNDPARVSKAWALLVRSITDKKKAPH